MIIRLYNNTAEQNRLNKTAHITQIGSDISGTLRDECDIIHPVIEIEYNQIPTCNYCYIVEFDKYYFIDDVIIVRNNLYQLRMTEDVLMSFRGQNTVTPFTGLYAVKALLSRCGDLLYASTDKVDDRLPLSADYHITRYTINNNIFDISYNPLADAKKCYVVVIAGIPTVFTAGHPTPAGIAPLIYPDSRNLPNNLSSNIYICNKGQLRTLFTKLNSENLWSQVLEHLYGVSSQALISVCAYPFDLTTLDADGCYLTDTQISIGGLPIPGAYARQMNDKFNPIINIGFKYISRQYHNFLDYEPYTTFEMFLPYVGTVEIPASEAYGQINVKYVIDYQTGKCKAYVTTGVNRIIATGDGQIGVPVAVLNSNANDIGNQALQLSMNTLLHAFSNKKDDVFSDAVKATGVSAMPSYRASVSGISSAQCEPSTITLWKKWKEDISDIDYITYNGLPSTDSVQIGSIDTNAYFEVDKIHIENLDGILSDEIIMLENVLKTGVIA